MAKTNKKTQGDGIPTNNYFKPRLLLFLSVDIVGSTAYKQANSHLRSIDSDGNATGRSYFAPWAGQIENFYRLFPHTFQVELSNARSNNKDLLGKNFSLGDNPELWKAVGDELIFKKEITDSRQVAIVVLAWIKTLKIVKEKLDPKLNLKSGIWTAGFPVMNNEFIFEKNVEKYDTQSENLVKNQFNLLEKRERSKDKSNYFSDFLGPNIDIGFRICAHASPRKLVLSIEAAHILATQLDFMPLDEAEKKPVFYLDAYIDLKGVFGGVQYPIFWLDLMYDRKINQYEDTILHRTPIPAQAIKDFSDAFYEENHRYLFRPFIEGDVGNFAKKPKDYNAILENWKIEMTRLARIETSAPDNSLSSNGRDDNGNAIDSSILDNISPLPESK